MNMTKLNDIARDFDATHAAYLREWEAERKRIEGEHAAEVARARQLANGMADIAFLNESDRILSGRLSGRHDELRAQRDATVRALRQALNSEAERIRGTQAAQRHALRLATSPAVPGEKAAAMRQAISGAATFVEIQQMHADALAAGDEPAAYWLEINSDSEIERVGRAVDLAAWGELRAANRSRRGGVLAEQIDSTDAAINRVQVISQTYRTTDEAAGIVERYSIATPVTDDLLSIVA